MLTVVIGFVRTELSSLVAKSAGPFVLFADPADPPPEAVPGQVGTVMVPFKNDPLSVLRIPLSEKLRAVFSSVELGLLPAAMLAEAHGLPTVPVAAVLVTRNKFLMRRSLAAHFDQPQFGLAGDDSSSGLPYPVIVKPVDGSGSHGVEYVDNPVAYRQALARREHLMWEEYLDGPEYSVEAVSWNGRHQILGITAKLTSGTPNFIEVGHLVPAPISSAAVRDISDAVCRCLDLLHVSRGASHTEVKLVDSRPVIVETHTRVGGDRIPLLHRLTSGCDQYALALSSVLESEVPSQAERQFAFAGVRFFRWPAGVLAGLAGVESARELPGVVELMVKVRPGDYLPEWKHSRDRPGFVVVGGDSPEEVEERLDRVERLVQPTYGQ